MIFWDFLTEVAAEYSGLIYCPEVGDRVEEEHFYVFLLLDKVRKILGK
jgi:hypothetical protein